MKPEPADALFSVDGKVAVITGGTGVLGSRMAEALAARGCKVAVGSRTRGKAEKLVAALRERGGEVLALEIDVTNRASVEAAAAEVVKAWGRVDILVNGAGGNVAKATIKPELSIFDMPIEALDEVIRLNLQGTVIPTQVFGRLFAGQKEGVIVNLSSMAAQRPLTRVVGYGASKAAIDNFTRWMAVHMAKEYGAGIRVNAIAPGFFETEQNRALLRDAATGQLTERGGRIIDHTPMGRFGEPDELIGALLLLVSPAGKFITGTVLAVDGGFSAYAGV